MVVKPTIGGGVAALAFRQFFGANGTIRIMGRNTNVGVVGFVIGAAASVITDITTAFILPHITKDRRTRHFESLALTLGTSAAVFWAVPRFMAAGGDQNSSTTVQNLMLAGVLSEIISQWIYESFFQGDTALLRF